MSNNKDGSIAPKERINIRYVPKMDGRTAEVELPLSLLVTGDLLGRPDDTPWMSVSLLRLTETP